MHEMKVAESLRVDPAPSEVEKLNLWLDASFERAGTDRKAASDLKLCVNEVVANLISYAFDETASPSITVELELDAKSAKAVVLDNGRHFDFSQWPQSEKPTTLATTKPGGFGIALIRERAVRLNYGVAGGLNRLAIECTASP